MGRESLLADRKANRLHALIVEGTVVVAVTRASIFNPAG